MIVVLEVSRIRNNINIVSTWYCYYYKVSIIAPESLSEFIEANPPSINPPKLNNGFIGDDILLISCVEGWTVVVEYGCRWIFGFNNKWEPMPL